MLALAAHHKPAGFVAYSGKGWQLSPNVNIENVLNHVPGPAVIIVVRRDFLIKGTE